MKRSFSVALFPILFFSGMVLADPPQGSYFLPQPAPVAPASQYYMELIVRHRWALPLIRHHDYVYTEVAPDGQVRSSFEFNWGWDPSSFQITRPLASLRGIVPGKMSTVAESEAQAASSLTTSRRHVVPVTQAAFESARQKNEAIRSGQMGYNAFGKYENGPNCIVSGVPPIAGPIHPGVGPLAAPRILRVMGARGLIAR